jgi:HlyD family secretion protein
MARNSVKQKGALRVPKFSFVGNIWRRIKGWFRGLTGVIQRRPILSFIIALAILLGLILAGNFLFKPAPPPPPAQPQAKSVKTYSIGSVPKVTVQGQVQNTGVITITALSPGIVQKINVTEGQQVEKGTTLVNLSSNYAGQNAAAIQQGIAYQQYKQITDTYDSQKQIIQHQRDMANLTNQNTQNLQNISSQSVVDLQAIGDLNQNMLDTVRQNLASLENAPVSTESAQQILQLKQAENQLQQSQNQVHQQVLNIQYQANPSNPPLQLSELQKQTTLQQLEIQEKQLDNSKQIASLQLALAAINTSLLAPTAPFPGSVQRILVREGQSVSPGMPLMILTNTDPAVTVIAKVPQTIAGQISQLENSILHLGTQTVSTKPIFVSSVATDGLLYSVIYNVPPENTKGLTDNDFVSVDVPVGVPDTTSTTPFVPLDAIFQTQDHSYLYVAENGVAKTRTVTTGTVTGTYVEITSGLATGDQVILDRNVVEGDKVAVQ